MPKLEVRELKPSSWPSFEALFGQKGACAGCWCIFWRLERGERFADVQHAPAKARMKKLVQAGKAQGLLAFANGAPVGWLALGKRRDFAKLDRAPSLECDDADQVWSLPCFFVERRWRGQGVATALLEKALVVLKSRGARVVEGYPLAPARKGERVADAFAHTGTVPLFLKHGFEVVAPRPKGKQRVRRLLRPPGPARAPPRESR